MGLAAPWHVGSSSTRDRTRVPCIGRQILNHCATGEVPARDFLREPSVKENGERAWVGGRLKELSDHEAGLVLGEGEREERKVGWISIVLREFGKATGESLNKIRGMSVRGMFHLTGTSLL